MSAIAGWLNLDGTPADAQCLAGTLDRMKHLGPDGAGLWSQGPVALGHLRLSITPESQGETSPHLSRDGQRVIVFDGRLDHRDDLIAALGLSLAERSAPDPELILRAHEQWGEACANRLEGEFTFALWDVHQRELFCARDVFGHRSFHYYTDGRRFIFATQIGGVLAAPGVPRVLDEQTLAAALGHRPAGPPRPATLYAGVLSLPGASTLTLRPGMEPRVRAYWQLTMEPELRLGSPTAYAEALRDMLERAVRSALRTRHPVAAMLSGGLDSTGVACLAAQELATHGQPLITVSNVLPEEYRGEGWKREESSFIQNVLDRHPNMAAHWAHGRQFPVVDFDDAHYARHDSPEGDPKSFRARELFFLAEQQGARVTLGGLGGDMAASFRGTGHLEQLMRRGRWLELVTEVRQQARVREMRAAGIFRREVFRPLTPEWLRRWNDRLRHDRENEGDFVPIHPEFAARIGICDPPEWDQPQDFRRLQIALANTGRIGGGGSWARSHCPHMESPQPLMDRRIWEWCHRVPLGEFVRDGMPRSLYRRALHDVLPEPILRRTGKGWFAPDYQQRLTACRPTMQAFLERHPASDPIWNYVDRPKVEATLRRLGEAGSGVFWDNRYQLILTRGLRTAHFLAWLQRTGVALP